MGRKGNMMEQKGKMEMEDGMQERVSETEYKNSSIMVSICCITYNQASYIRDALEGFVNQKTDFAYEVLIHDDASNDGTADIIREYADRYPDLIFPILQTENQVSPMSAAPSISRGPEESISPCAREMITGRMIGSYRSRWIIWKRIQAVLFAFTAQRLRYRERL